MCELCKIVASAKSPEESRIKIHHSDPLCVIVDHPREKPKKDGFQPVMVIYRQHEIEPLPPVKEAIIQTAKRMFRDRKLWFPQTKGYTLEGERLPLSELDAHWWFIIE